MDKVNAHKNNYPSKWSKLSHTCYMIPIQPSGAAHTPRTIVELELCNFKEKQA
jgi:hypothetical protein